MHSRLRLSFSMVLGLSALLANTRCVDASVIEWRINKGQNFVQVANNVQPTVAEDYTFDALLFTTDAGDFSSVTLSGGLGGSFTQDGTVWERVGDFLTKPALDAAFPNSTAYQINTSGGTLGSFNENVPLATDRYPTQVPYLTGNTFDELSTFDVSQDLLLTWNLPSSGGPQVTGAVIEIYEIPTDNSAFFTGLLSPGTTSILMPGGTLLPGSDYEFYIEFPTGVLDVRDGFDTGFGVTGFNTATASFFTTAVSVPEPTTLTLFGVSIVCALGYQWRRKRKKVA